MRRGHLVLMSLALAAATIVAYAWQPAQEASADGKVTCEQACAYRKKCGVPNSDDLAACGQGCAKISPLLGAKDLETYVKGSCDKAKEAEYGFTAALGCTIACEHRATCVGTAAAKDSKSCIGGCLSTYTGPEPVQQYIGAKCEQVKQLEPLLLAGFACAKACERVVTCKLPNATMKLCMDQCTEGVQQKRVTLAAVEGVPKQECSVLKTSLKYEKPVSTAEMSVKAGRTGQKCMNTGVDDCPYFSMCCANGGPTNGMRSGMCISPAICYMPRR